MLDVVLVCVATFIVAAAAITGLARAQGRAVSARMAPRPDALVEAIAESMSDPEAKEGFTGSLGLSHGSSFSAMPEPHARVRTSLGRGSAETVGLAVTAAAISLRDWYDVDAPLLDAFGRYRNEDIENGIELWRSIAGHGDATALNLTEEPVIAGLRGHWGEQVVAGRRCPRPRPNPQRKRVARDVNAPAETYTQHAAVHSAI